MYRRISVSTKIIIVWQQNDAKLLNRIQTVSLQPTVVISLNKFFQLSTCLAYCGIKWCDKFTSSPCLKTMHIMNVYYYYSSLQDAYSFLIPTTFRVLFFTFSTWFDCFITDVSKAIQMLTLFRGNLYNTNGTTKIN